MAHGQEIQIGDKTFTALHTPGHASHHIAWQLEDTVFTGDLAGVKIGAGPVVPPCPPPDIDIEAWQASLQLVKARNPSELYLTHYGLVTEVQNHLDQVEAILLDWAQWIKPHAEAGADPKTLTPKFQQYVSQQLIAAGVDNLGLEQYEAANPSWMSVAGLMRYWHKKQQKTQ